jgi:hypothetical protein
MSSLDLNNSQTQRSPPPVFGENGTNDMKLKPLRNKSNIRPPKRPLLTEEKNINDSQSSVKNSSLPVIGK